MMASSEVLSEYVMEYTASRLRDPVLVSWVGGSLAFLATVYATSSGRQLAKEMPPPSIRGIQGTIVRGQTESARRRPTASAFMLSSALLLPASPMSSSAILPSVSTSAPPTLTAAQSGQASPEVSVFRRFVQLLHVALPSHHGREARSILILFVLMLARACVSVRIVSISGRISHAAMGGNLRHVLRALLLFAVSCVPATLLNVTLDYYSEMLGLYYRENIASYLSERYLKRRVFFQLAGLHEVDRVDQRITEDVRNWARVSASLFTSVPRPLIEAVAFSFALAKQTGWKGTLLTWFYYSSFAAWVVCFAPNLDWMVVQRMEKESAVRAAHQSLRTHAEEITVTKGFPFYESLLQRLFSAVTDQSRYAAYVRGRFDLTEVLHNKYGSVLLGYIVCAMAVVHQGGVTKTPEGATATLTRVSYVFKTLATAIGRFLWSIKLMFVISGYTRRLAQFLAALDRADMLVEMQTDRTAHSPIMCRPSGAFPVSDENERLLVEYDENSFGRIVRGEHIEFIDVPLVLPTGECLCSSLSFSVKPGMNLLIIGRNGCGKSSTFRLLGELWPLRGGRIVKPEAEQLYYVPQRPYMFDGTLLEQVIYPLKKKDLTVGEAELYGYLKMVGLDYVFTKSNMSWETRLSWSDETLSLGEQQRLAMARLFFHRPRFAILDECSSLIDLDVERHMYERCGDLGITVITIAHRRTVWQYHNWILYFDGNGGYMFSPLHYETGASALVLTSVRSASDPSLVGTEVRVPITDRLCDEDRRAATPPPSPQHLSRAEKTADSPIAPMEGTTARKEQEEEEAGADRNNKRTSVSNRRSRRRRSNKAHEAFGANRTIAFVTPAETDGDV
ncbi:hypothetical protein JKF63_03791 [Porcisia hertigi]|uniref:ABC transporter domain-containing protein n=1 Tax=Porcisia hertigi TaxID=2761500 RepID=A0A836L558_9TRYP|nr:hypothetical protein JKF63_03791 [Porcisia hertigi]